MRDQGPTAAKADIDLKTTLADDLRRLIADEIMEGRHLPGTHLDEQELATRFGTSRTPVREALKLLGATGLVLNRPHKGVIVAALTPERVTEMFEAMGEIEASCARFAALRMTTEDKQGLIAIHSRAEAAVRVGEPNAYDEINTEFHTAIYQGTHNSFMEETARAIRLRLRPYRRAQFRVGGRLKHSWMEHDAVVRAILRGDAETAFHAMRAHVTAVSTASTEYLTTLLPELLPRP
jgi:DNA-binding GntR family transcriptional regulator